MCGLEVDRSMGPGTPGCDCAEVIIFPKHENPHACYACAARFPGCRQAYEEMVQAGYLEEKVCEEAEDQSANTGPKWWWVD